MPTTLEVHHQRTKRLARQILVALTLAGREVTRRELSQAHAGLSWRPTIGEMSDALRLLESLGRIVTHAADGSYWDFGDTRISVAYAIRRTEEVEV